MQPTIHILEPTLTDHRGHSRSLVQQICDAGTDQRFGVWAGLEASPALIDGDHVDLRPWFRRRVRVPQTYVLLKRLLRTQGIVCLSTAGRTEVLLVDRAMGSASANRTFLYVHWLRPTRSRLRALSAVASRRPDLRFGAATESVRDCLVGCGFTNVNWIPYPMTSKGQDQPTTSGFRHVLYAGAARRDKGFHYVVDLVARWRASGRSVPITTQVGGDYFGRMSAEVRNDVARLTSLAYPALTEQASGLDPAVYEDQFHGAVCLQLYDPQAFQDRASGVTLDALAAGAPIVAWEGGWIARQIERFGAGKVVAMGDLEGVDEAIDTIRRDYGAYAQRAGRAGSRLAGEHDPRGLVDAILSR